MDQTQAANRDKWSRSSGELTAHGEKKKKPCKPRLGANPPVLTIQQLNKFHTEFKVQLPDADEKVYDSGLLLAWCLSHFIWCKCHTGSGPPMSLEGGTCASTYPQGSKHRECSIYLV